jgi:hypothetical protein
VGKVAAEGEVAKITLEPQRATTAVALAATTAVAAFTLAAAAATAT